MNPFPPQVDKRFFLSTAGDPGTDADHVDPPYSAVT